MSIKIDRVGNAMVFILGIWYLAVIPSQISWSRRRRSPYVGFQDTLELALETTFTLSEGCNTFVTNGVSQVSAVSTLSKIPFLSVHHWQPQPFFAFVLMIPWHLQQSFCFMHSRTFRAFAAASWASMSIKGLLGVFLMGSPPIRAMEISFAGGGQMRFVPRFSCTYFMLPSRSIYLRIVPFGAVWW